MMCILGEGRCGWSCQERGNGVGQKDVNGCCERGHGSG